MISRRRALCIEVLPVESKPRPSQCLPDSANARVASCSRLCHIYAAAPPRVIGSNTIIVAEQLFTNRCAKPLQFRRMYKNEIVYIGCGARGRVLVSQRFEFFDWL
jgi:hypothetical protein